MDEIEVKFLEIDVPAIKRKLARLGAKKTFDGKLVSHAYDFTDGSIRKRKALLRLRTDGKETYLTYKQLKSRTGIRVADEQETKITDLKETIAILDGLGLKEVTCREKHRSHYELGKVHFEIDTFPGIPTFLEIEAPSKYAIRKTAKMLGLSMKDAKHYTGGEVLKLYGKR